ncbi:Protein kinase-like domain containing protein [Parasponia andersonii]|uniref:Protein kinase-like domain containing protein n=1 Tax=Parasponia andersonii TaxID=3476 RepID=A0A2P5A4S9_PARAD|nr:Protein kinase-like domain containing protein [Parasponia andersonii]
MGGELSKQGDLYSYGILMLEMFTGKCPTDEMFKDDFNLHNFVKLALPERLLQIVDSSLLPREAEEITMRREDGRRYSNDVGMEIDLEERNINIENPDQISTHLQKCLESVLKIGLTCSEESPNQRMNMGDVINELKRIQNAYLGLGVTGRNEEPA